jgi:hypothetical protein
MRQFLQKSTQLSSPPRGGLECVTGTGEDAADGAFPVTSYNRHNGSLEKNEKC